MSREWSSTRSAPILAHQSRDGAREAVAGTYDTITPDQLLCFAGAEEGIYIASHVLLGRDDHAIVVTPNYQAAETVPLSISTPGRRWKVLP